MTSHIPTTTIPNLEKQVRLNLKRANGWQPMYVQGAPGLAKTYFWKNNAPEVIANELGCKPEEVGVILINPAIQDGVAIGGVTVPFATTEEEREILGDYKLMTGFTLSPVVAAAKRMLALPQYTAVILLWDELPQARDAEQRVTINSQDRSEHSINGQDLPKNVFVAATGNRSIDKSGAGRIFAMLRNRVISSEMIFNLASLLKHWDKMGWNPVVREWLEAADIPWDHAVPSEDRPFCTPRSVEHAGEILDTYMAEAEFGSATENDGGDVMFVPAWVRDMIAGVIGIEAATSLVRFISKMDCPSPSEIFSDPQGTSMPDGMGSQMFACNRALANAETADQAEAAFAYILRALPELRITLGAKVLNLMTENRWTNTSDETNAFIVKYSDMFPILRG